MRPRQSILFTEADQVERGIGEAAGGKLRITYGAHQECESVVLQYDKSDSYEYVV